MRLDSTEVQVFFYIFSNKIRTVKIQEASFRLYFGCLYVHIILHLFPELDQWK